MNQQAERPTRPRRPVLVEVASAILVVGGVISLLTSIEVVLRLGQEGQPVEGLAALSFAIGTAFLVLGILIRYGRAWLITVNVVAVAGFLELLSPTVPGLLFGGLDVFVVLALFREHAWFQWSAPASNQPFTPPTARPPTR